ncbi:hypothetical protein [Microbacterium hibisci]|uniref:hypothetical protein n=1 Tax=Microbacterium hibisci TaxID=2036000 RepID=UPI00194162EE|nr:hypothetical protein [Microbacterium hibisci]
MTNQNPLIPPLGGDDDDRPLDDGVDRPLADGVDDAVDDGDGVLGRGDDDRPLDPDLDDDQIDSATADERAATEGTLDVDDRP